MRLERTGRHAGVPHRSRSVPCRLGPAAPGGTRSTTTTAAASGTTASPTDPTAPVATSAWSPLGPSPLPNGQTQGTTGFNGNPVSGRVTSIVIDPTNKNTVYVGAA